MNGRRSHLERTAADFAGALSPGPTADGGPRREPVTPVAWLETLAPVDLRLSPLNTRVTFSIRWLGGMVVRGRFEDVSGRVQLPRPGDGDAMVAVQICAASVRTGIALRDRHLRGPMFLFTARYPEIGFRGGPPLHRATHLALPGTLTIRDISRKEELRCARARDILVVETTLRRRDYDVGAPTGLRRLDPLFKIIGDDVHIHIEVALGA